MKRFLAAILSAWLVLSPVISFLPQASATLSEVTARNDYTGNGSTTVFSYTFRITSNTHIEVLVDGAVKVLTTDYTISGVDAQAGGSVTFVTAPATGTKIALLRKQPLDQQSDYIPNEAFPSERIEKDLDKLAMQSQMQAEQTVRSLKVPKKSTLTGTQTEIDIQACGDKYFKANAAGTGMECLSLSTAVGALPLPVSPNNGGTGMANTTGSTQAGLIAAGTAGRIARVTDENAYGVRGLYLDNGSQWAPRSGEINIREFPGVTGNCNDDQTTGVTNFITALNTIPAQLLRQGGYVPRGCYRYTAALPNISGNGVRIRGDGVQTVFFNATASTTVPALKVTGQNVSLESFLVSGIPGSGHGIHLLESHYFYARQVFVDSAGTGQNGWQVEGVITGTFIDVRGTCNIPGCQQYTTDITNNGGRGTPGRAVNILDGPTFSNNDHTWVGFKNNGGHSGHGVVIGGVSTGINFFSGVFEGAPVGFNVLLFGGTGIKNNTVVAPYISCSTGLGLEINDALATTVIGGQSNCLTVLRGDARANEFYGFETTGNFDILVDGADTPRVNSIFGGRITGTITDNGLNTTILGVTDNTNGPKDNKLAGRLAWNGGASIDRPLSATASLDFTALAANSCEVLTITVTNAASGDPVNLGIPDALADVDGATERTVFFGWVSAANTVSVRRCNVTGTVTADPAAATVRALVWKF